MFTFGHLSGYELEVSYTKIGKEELTQNIQTFLKNNQKFG